MRRKHPSKKAREKTPGSQDRKECALLGNSENGSVTGAFPGGGRWTKSEVVGPDHTSTYRPRQGFGI